MSSSQERPVAIALGTGGDALEGLYVGASRPDSEGAGGAVVAPPHPLYGGSMDSPVVNEIAYACRTADLASLCFNWRGVGASAGIPSGDAADAAEDYAAAVAYLAETVDPPLTACGYSFGAVAALRVGCAQTVVRRLVLVAPPPALLDLRELEEFGGPLLVVAGEQDSIAPADTLASLAAELDHATFAAIPEADHFFGVGLREIGKAVSGFLGSD